MRLELLTEDKRCCDIALNLARFIIRCLSIGDICLQEDGTEEDIMFINYIYLVLLAKFNRGDEITGFVSNLKDFQFSYTYNENGRFLNTEHTNLLINMIYHHYFKSI